MNNKEIDNVTKLPAEIRYEYFIKKVVDYEQVWGLYKDGWAMTGDNDGNIMMPFWPKQEFAQFCAVGEWEGYIPESIELCEFIEDCIPALNRKGHKPSVFWNNNDSAVVEVNVLLHDLQNESDKY